jgi:hypothetical protein
MPIFLPRLNQLCSHYTVTVNKYGKKNIDTTTNNIKARYSTKKLKIKTGTGDIKEYSGYIHAQVVDWQDGQGVLLENGLTYELQDVKITHDLEGQPSFTFAYLQEKAFF